MSLVGSLDAIAVKAETMSGLKRCYSATGGGVSSTLRPIPRSIDDTPVGVVWIGSAEMAGGNSEFLIVDVRVDVWVRADDAGWAYKTLAAFPDLARTAFRSDMDLGGQATRCQLTGWDEPESETVNERQFLVLPLRLGLLIVRQASDATA
jgi:hypothetical protein